MFRNKHIQQQLITVILVITGAALLLTCASFFAYEFFDFRKTAVRELSTLGEIIASNSTAALAFDNRDDASEILSALQAEKHIAGASLYDKENKLFSHYPANLSPLEFPSTPEQQGFRFENSHLVGFLPVVQGNRHLGTLYLKSDMGAMAERFRLYSIIALTVVAVSFLMAYLLSKSLAQRI